RDGAVSGYTAMARLGHVSTARVTQIMNLVLLAPDIQEEILFLTRTLRGRDPIRPHHLQPIALTLDWHTQRALWRRLQAATSPYRLQIGDADSTATPPAATPRAGSMAEPAHKQGHEMRRHGVLAITACSVSGDCPEIVQPQ